MQPLLPRMYILTVRAGQCLETVQQPHLRRAGGKDGRGRAHDWRLAEISFRPAGCPGICRLITHNQLYTEICSFENLLLAARRAEQGKRMQAGILFIIVYKQFSPNNNALNSERLVDSKYHRREVFLAAAS
jgi:hypothetical protein